MIVRFPLILILALTLLSGCRTDPHLQVYIDSMNAEKRLLEDTLYDLQYDYETKVDEVEQLRRELDEVKGGTSSGGARSGGARSGGARSGTLPQSDRSGSALDGAGDMFPEIPDLRPPSVEPGTRSAPKKPQDDTPEGMDDIKGLEPPKLELGEEGLDVSVAPLPLNQQVTQLYLNPALTGGLQQDDQPGDDGITVVFEPRNASNEFVSLPARVTVVLLDPDRRSRVARWELNESETKMALQKAQSGRGLQLDLPWQDAPPQQSRLHLFVRYWLPGGRAVEQDREITITPAGQVAARWTPRSEQRPETPSRRINVAEVPAAHANGSGAESSAAEPRALDPSSPADIPAKQAQRPEWRPVR